MLKYDLKDGEMVVNEDGEYIHVSDLRALKVGLDQLHERLKEMRVHYPMNTYYNQVFPPAILIIESILRELKDE